MTRATERIQDNMPSRFNIFKYHNIMFNNELAVYFYG